MPKIYLLTQRGSLPSRRLSLQHMWLRGSYIPNSAEKEKHAPDFVPRDGLKRKTPQQTMRIVKSNMNLSSEFVPQETATTSLEWSKV